MPDGVRSENITLSLVEAGVRHIAHIAKTRPNKFSRTYLSLVQSVVHPVEDHPGF
jgi:hypothetical protein